jgi:hypothetical protein
MMSKKSPSLDLDFDVKKLLTDEEYTKARNSILIINHHSNFSSPTNQNLNNYVNGEYDSTINMKLRQVTRKEIDIDMLMEDLGLTLVKEHTIEFSDTSIQYQKS